MSPRTDREWEYMDDAFCASREREPEPWSSIPCACGARYRVSPWGEAPRWQCEECEAREEDEERFPEDEEIVRRCACGEEITEGDDGECEECWAQRLADDYGEDEE